MKGRRGAAILSLKIYKKEKAILIGSAIMKKEIKNFVPKFSK